MNEEIRCPYCGRQPTGTAFKLSLKPGYECFLSCGEAPNRHVCYATGHGETAELAELDACRIFKTLGKR